MEIRVLGCNGSQLPGHGFTGFLINGKTLLDAGAVTSVLTLEEQIGIDQVLITHAHLDHIQELASLLDNICYAKRDFPLTVISTASVIETIKKHIFNDAIWPDFSIIPSPEKPILKFVAIPPREETQFGDLRVMAIPVHHAVDTVGYRVEGDWDGPGAVAVFTGDTGPTDEIWQIACKGVNVRAVFVETSLPEEMEGMATMTGHLTPGGLHDVLKKLGPMNTDIYLYHMKLQSRDAICREIKLLGKKNIHILHDGQVVRI